MKQERDEIRETVFKRDNNKCVCPYCQSKPDDAHHLIERKLWDEHRENGGYLMNNLVSVCEGHHKLCENNTIFPQTLREWAGIWDVILPSSFDNSKEYDKWGKELDAPKRETLKYPHTPYLPFSPNADEKDVEESGYAQIPSLLNKPLWITIKMDGSNVVLTHEYVAARNGYDATHVSFDMVKQLHAQCKYHIPEDIMIFGEWLYAKHSIHYVDDLKVPHLLQVFGAYNKKTHMWLGMVDVMNLCQGIVDKIDKDNPVFIGVPSPYGWNNSVELYNNRSFATNEKEFRSKIIQIGNRAIAAGHEGIVVRNPYAFHNSRWSENIAKYVRANHVQTNEHWRSQPVVRNETR